METNFQKALDTGRVVLRKWWENSKNPDQVTLQFFQQIESGSQENSLVSIAQGAKNKQTISALFSFKKSVALAKLGSTEGNLVNSSDVVFADKVFGTQVSIRVTENFTPNPYSASHEPKINPSTGEVVEGFNSATGKNEPVYRHTDLVEGIIGAEAHTWAPKANAEAEVAPFKTVEHDFLSR